MTTFDLDDIHAAFRNYWTLGAVGEDWDAWCDTCFTDDVTYIEHILGNEQGREAVRAWITSTMEEYGAIARLAPDLDILEEIQRVHTEIAARHGIRLANELGIDPALTAQFDMNAVKAAMGVPDVDRLTYREVQERRELIKARLEEKRKRA